MLEYNGTVHIAVVAAGFFILGLIFYVIYNILKHRSHMVKLE